MHNAFFKTDFKTFKAVKLLKTAIDFEEVEMEDVHEITTKDFAVFIITNDKDVDFFENVMKEKDFYNKAVNFGGGFLLILEIIKIVFCLVSKFFATD